MDYPDYKATLNLPNTDFQMKAELSKREPEILKGWEGTNLYEKITKADRAKGLYTLHDGPPYANGNIHIGHALNKILKDIIIKSRFMSGYSIEYVPGWDCHGLPIELQVEKELGKDKLTATKGEVREKCRTYAKKYVDIQREEFKRLGIFGRWDEPYLTMNYSYQSAIMRELGRFQEKGLIYRDKKPIHWCASCRTALAEAEVEHADKTSPAVFAKFKVVDAKKNLEVGSDKGTFFVIWTTTPWTLPANMAVAVNPRLTYCKVSTPAGELIINKELLANCMESFNFSESDYEIDAKTYLGSELEGIELAHPFIDRRVPVLLGDFVTTEAGTGCVHIAPGHGHDDYILGKKHGLEVYAPVNDFGKFTKDFPECEGQFVFKANSSIIELLRERDSLLGESDLTHSYPHCWRCKRPVIFRATAQWFISMEVGHLRKKALEVIDNVNWIPDWGKGRITSMVSGRPDWCLSRQRAWGVPIPALKCTPCEESFLDESLIAHLVKRFKEDGADIWFTEELSELLPKGIKCPRCGKDDLTKEEDILDVWFDSGVSFAAVLEERDYLNDKAELYLEGSDQHRGWFQSALLTSVGTRDTAPFKSVLTHGFVVDGKGRKMSKSLGNVIAPNLIIEKYGVEVLRLWVASEDYRDEMRISDEIIKRISEAYRRIRNTIRFILGNISDFNPDTDSVDYSELTELDRLTLHRLSLLTDKVEKAYDDFEFHAIYHSVHNFCAVDLSAFYLDILKDCLYTAKPNSKVRRAAQTTIHHILDTLLRLLAPILVFTTDEAWQFMPSANKAESVHLSEFPKIHKEWQDAKLAEKWETILSVKSELSKAIEGARRDKRIGHSLDAKVEFTFTGDSKKLIEEETSTLKEILIVSEVTMVDTLNEGDVFVSEELEGLSVVVTKANAAKCERCWHISKSVGEDKEHPTVCKRCVEALS